MATVELVRERVQRLLTDAFGQIVVHDSGNMSVRLTPADGDGPLNASTSVAVRVEQLPDNATLVTVAAPVLFDLQPSPELYRFVATASSELLFGNFELVPLPDGTMVLGVRNTLLGEHLDPDELVTSVRAVGLAADVRDEQLQERFGGSRASDR